LFFFEQRVANRAIPLACDRALRLACTRSKGRADRVIGELKLSLKVKIVGIYREKRSFLSVSATK